MVRLLGRVAGALAAAALAASPAPAELLVGAASSLREVTEALLDGFAAAPGGGPARASFAASSLLAAQIEAGAPLDLILSADPHTITRLAERGHIEAGSRVVFARNRLVVVATPELAGRLRSPGELAGPAVRRLALPDGAVPVGRYAREWLSRHGIEAALRPRVVRTDHARATLAAVDLGHADAAIVYATDARIARRAVVAFEIPDPAQPDVRYEAAIVAGSRHRPEAAAFLAYLVGPGAEALSAAGFLAPGAGAPR